MAAREEPGEPGCDHMPFVSINGSNLYYEDSGGSGPAILFSHGFLLDHSMWDAQVASLRDDFRCVTWDERGHGMSECEGEYTFWDLADDAAELLDHLGIERAVIVGMSQGGFLSMRFALRYPSKTASLFLVDTKAALDPPEVQEGYLQWAEAWTTMGPVGELVDQMVQLQFGPDFDASAWVGKWQSRPPSTVRTQWTSVVNGRDDVAARLGEITCPSHIVVGEHDGAFPPEVAEEMCSELGSCTGVTVVAGGHHAPNVTHPQEVNVAIRTFLEAHGP